MPRSIAVQPMPRIVVMDTCVLLSSVLRTVLFALARQDLFRPAWSAVIGLEWRRNAGRIWQLDAEEMQRQWAALQEAFPQADQGDIRAFEEGLRYSDPKDWHVIAAARAAQRAHGEATILTRNLKDFSRRELRPMDIAVLDPDRFLVQCLERHPRCLRAVMDDLPETVRRDREKTEALAVILKRERLFRLNRLLQES